MTSYTYTITLDNYVPARSHATGLLTRQSHPVTGVDMIVISPHVTNENESIYLIDDGATVSVWYVAGWKDGELFLNQFPTNAHGERRPDGRIIDYRNWQMGPRRAYHVKVEKLNV